ncbi:Deoxycytidine monophosphate (dCMP) deaminase [Scheffersomyces spartinae]|uniref:Deoxycytidylate deaminase n=1 Tax=Scheffersomyces spartinae TaxID=45513 RepID=A0A9P7V549_9ASCO|nr:Deoxycytidine monophosphate (dCMP) deaminase [Scheffersomyces spartinae]KAG7191420.1 Deoxycytidine monophosphate (dCMP) deaminase [Scheffersomyces spartinae]
MLILISGTLSAGKTEVARYLTFRGFKLLEYTKNSNHIDNRGSDLLVHQLFNGLEQLLAFVTVHWRENYVVSHVSDVEMMQILCKRPFVLHVSVDAPMTLRLNRYRTKNTTFPDISLEDFAIKSDQLLYKERLVEVCNLAQVKIINTSESVKDLFVKLEELDLLNKERLRPTWDSYFMQLADLAALRSNCMKRRVGCVIVRDNRVVATGYNGTPRHLTNCNEGGCIRCNSAEGSGTGLSTCLCLHAEENALLEAGRDRISNQSVLYCNTCPCLTCSIKIIQSGIKEVIYAQSYSMDDLSHKVMSEAGIILRQFQAPMDGVFV